MIQVLRRWFMAMAALLGASGSGGSVGDVQVTLRDSALIGDSRVRLSDVAVVSGRSRRLVARLGAVDVGPAPWPGDHLLLRRSTLAAHLRRLQRSLDGAVVHWSGPDAVSIRRDVRQVDSGAIQSVAEQALEVWLAQRPLLRHQVSVLAPPVAVPVAAGPLTLSACGLAASQMPAGIVTVWVELQVDGWVARRVPVVLFVRAFVRRWSARADLPSGRPIAEGDFEPADVELQAPYRLVPTDLPLGTRLARPLLAGQLLEQGHVAEVFDVTRGALITADVRMGQVNVQARAEALQDGRNGQRVRVRIAGATSPVLAQVIGPGRVQVSE